MSTRPILDFTKALLLVQRTSSTPLLTCTRFISTTRRANMNGDGSPPSKVPCVELAPVLKCKKLTELATIPTRGSSEAAGYDLYRYAWLIDIRNSERYRAYCLHNKPPSSHPDDGIVGTAKCLCYLRLHVVSTTTCSIQSILYLALPCTEVVSLGAGLL